MFQIIKKSHSHVFRCVLLKIHARESVSILKKNYTTLQERGFNPINSNKNANDTDSINSGLMQQSRDLSEVNSHFLLKNIKVETCIA